MTIADDIWGDSHRYGCKCKKNEGDRDRARYSDGSLSPCPVASPCPTASVEWNSVRAAFAQANNMEPLSRIASNLEELATAPLMGTDKDAVQSVASAISELAQAVE